MMFRSILRMKLIVEEPESGRLGLTPGVYEVESGQGKLDKQGPRTEAGHPRYLLVELEVDMTQTPEPL